MIDVFPAPRKPVKTVMGILEGVTGTTIVLWDVYLNAATNALCDSRPRWDSDTSEGRSAREVDRNRGCGECPYIETLVIG